MNEDDDIPEARPSRRKQPVPGGVRVAGIVWIVCGFVEIFWPCVGLIGAADAPPDGGNADAVHGANTGFVWPLLCGFVLAVVFLIFGVQTVQGIASGVLVRGLCSILLGTGYLGVGVLTLAASGAVIRQGFSPASVYLLGTGQVLLGLFQIAAGVLAALGHPAYMEWRADNGLTRRYRG